MAGAGRSLIDEVFHRPDPSGRASPRKARRRGLRRTSSALTTTILGAIIMASTVSAQQFLPSASSRRGGAAASASASESAPTPDSATAPEPPAGSKADPIFGMAASRGARYLLRNGIDYLSYQEYERALKYFREAETRQKELNEAERLSLKQGIERASAGFAKRWGVKHPTRSANDRTGPADSWPPSPTCKSPLPVRHRLNPDRLPPRRESPVARETSKASPYALPGPKSQARRQQPQQPSPAQSRSQARCRSHYP